MTKTATLKMDTCTQCPFFSRDRDYTSDSFEYVERWYCKKKEKDIRRYVDWNDKQKYIPEWCPLTKKTKKKKDGKAKKVQSK